MSTDINKLIEKVKDYVGTFRKSGMDEFEISEPYNLFPKEAKTIPTQLQWPDTWPNSGKAGVYAIFSTDGSIVYIGKSSMNSFLGARLSNYFGYAPDKKSCMIKGGDWSIHPEFIVTIGVPDSMTWEAPALEEYLIQQLNPELNKQGRTK